MYVRTFPTAASPRRTSLTLLLGLGAAAAAESDITVGRKGLEFGFDEVFGEGGIRWGVRLNQL
jgi:hypothetical protein